MELDDGLSDEQPSIPLESSFHYPTPFIPTVRVL